MSYSNYAHKYSLPFDSKYYHKVSKQFQKKSKSIALVGLYPAQLSAALLRIWQVCKDPEILVVVLSDGRQAKLAEKAIHDVGYAQVWMHMTGRVSKEYKIQIVNERYVDRLALSRSDVIQTNPKSRVAHSFRPIISRHPVYQNIQNRARMFMRNPDQPKGLLISSTLSVPLIPTEESEPLVTLGLSTMNPAMDERPQLVIDMDQWVLPQVNLDIGALRRGSHDLDWRSLMNYVKIIDQKYADMGILDYMKPRPNNKRETLAKYIYGAVTGKQLDDLISNQSYDVQVIGNLNSKVPVFL